MVMKIDMKKTVTTLLLFVMAFLGFTVASPVKAHASSGIGGVDVQIGDNGQMTIGGGDISTTGTSGSAWTNLIKKYRNFIVGIAGIGAVSMVLFFIMNFLKLGASSGNPSERSKILVGLIWSGVAAAGLGGSFFPISFGR